MLLSGHLQISLNNKSCQAAPLDWTMEFWNKYNMGPSSFFLHFIPQNPSLILHNLLFSANALKNTVWERCASHRLPLLLRTGGGWLTLLWGELRQLLLLQRVKDERTSGDLKMWQKDTTHTKNTKTKRETRGVRIKDGLEGSQAESGKNAHGDKSRGKWES